jgi:hypothetical protein
LFVVWLLFKKKSILSFKNHQKKEMQSSSCFFHTEEGKLTHLFIIDCRKNSQAEVFTRDFSNCLVDFVHVEDLTKTQIKNKSEVKYLTKLSGIGSLKSSHLVYQLQIFVA